MRPLLVPTAMKKALDRIIEELRKSAQMPLFEEGKHERYPKGHPNAGQFKPKDGAQTGKVAHSAQKRRDKKRTDPASTGLKTTTGHEVVWKRCAWNGRMSLGIAVRVGDQVYIEHEGGVVRSAEGWEPVTPRWLSDHPAAKHVVEKRQETPAWRLAQAGLIERQESDVRRRTPEEYDAAKVAALNEVVDELPAGLSQEVAARKLRGLFAGRGHQFPEHGLGGAEAMEPDVMTAVYLYDEKHGYNRPQWLPGRKTEREDHESPLMR